LDTREGELRLLALKLALSLGYLHVFIPSVFVVALVLIFILPWRPSVDVRIA
jgi:hypothetical protein